MDRLSKNRMTHQIEVAQQLVKKYSVENDEDIKKDFDPSLLGSCSE
jgi:hypothetical protein